MTGLAHRFSEIARLSGRLDWHIQRHEPDWLPLSAPVSVADLSHKEILALIKARNERFISLHLSLELEHEWQRHQADWQALGVTDIEQLTEYWQHNNHRITRELLHSLKLEAETAYLPEICNDFPQIKTLDCAPEERFLVVDPGSRSGIKLLAADGTGAIISQSIVFPHEPQNQWQQGLRKLNQFAQTTGVRQVVLLHGEGFTESRKFLTVWLREREQQAVYLLPGFVVTVLSNRCDSENQDNLYMRASQAARLLTNPAQCLSSLPLQCLLNNPLKTALNPLSLENSLRRHWHAQQEENTQLTPDPLVANNMAELADLKQGQALTGRVVNAAEFGYFLDVGLEQNGLLHNSQLHSAKSLAIGDYVSVYVAKIQSEKMQFSLTTKKPGRPAPKHKKARGKPAPGNSAMADALQAALKRK